MLARIRRTTYLRDVRRWSLGENLAWGTGRWRPRGRPCDAWMQSPGHRANILDRNFADIGIGIAPGAPVDGRARRPAAPT